MYASCILEQFLVDQISYPHDTHTTQFYFIGIPKENPEYFCVADDRGSTTTAELEVLELELGLLIPRAVDPSRQNYISLRLSLSNAYRRTSISALGYVVDCKMYKY